MEVNQKMKAVVMLTLLIVIANGIAAEIINNEIDHNNLEEYLRRTLVELIASEVDRNETNSALQKFEMIRDGENSIKDIVRRYVAKYQTNFLNLLEFISELSVFAVKYSGFNTLIDETMDKRVNPLNVLYFHEFVLKLKNQTKDFEYDEVLNKTGKETNAILNRLNLTEIFNVNDMHNSQLNRNILAIIANSDFGKSNMDNLLHFSRTLNSKKMEITLVKEIIKNSKVQNSTHDLFPLLLHLKQMRKTIFYEFNDTYALADIEKEFPHDWRPFLSNSVKWHIKNLYSNEFMVFKEISDCYNEKYIFTTPNKPIYQSWKTEVAVDSGAKVYLQINSDFYLYLDKCVHMDSFVRLAFQNLTSPYSPYYLDYSMRNGTNRFQPSLEPNSNEWYLNYDQTTSSFRIKSASSGEYLTVDDTYDRQTTLHRVGLTKSDNNDARSKWIFSVTVDI